MPETQEGPVWARRLASVLLAVFCFELGLMLLVYPWTAWWPRNYFAALLPRIWENSYFRGAVSGVGVVNLWLAMTEVFRMFSKP